MCPSNPPQSWEPDRYARNARFVADLGQPVIELLLPQPGERILDLGCGDGVLAERLVSAGCEVVAIDSSPEQIEAARRRGLDARVMDAEQLSFHREFDAVFSNAALHWMRRSGDVIDGVARALRPGGRFVGEFGGSGNVATIIEALYEALDRRGVDAATMNPWYFPSVGEYHALLQTSGFNVCEIRLFSRPTLLPGSMTDWLETFAANFTSALPAGEVRRFLEEVEELLRPRLCNEREEWNADYVRLRFATFLPHNA